MNDTVSLKKITIGSLLFFALFFLCMLFPYTGDDWAWGSSIGIERLQIRFVDYNGRYVGNLLVLALTRNIFLDAVVKAASVMLISILIRSVMKVESYWPFFVGIAGVMLMPRALMAESFVWTSGFTNYFFPAIWILGFMYLFDHIIECDHSSGKYGGWKYLTIAVFGFAFSLVMENLTIYFVVVSLGLLLFGAVKNRHADNGILLHLLVSVAAACVMFSNGAYRNVLEHKDTYRSVDSDGNAVVNAVSLFFEKLYKLFFMDYTLLTVAISLSAMLLAVLFMRKKRSIVLFIPLAVFTGYVLYVLLKLVNPTWMILAKYTPFFEGSVVLIWFIAMLALILMIDSDSKRLELFLIISYVIIVSPLFFVTPIGPRNGFPLYLLLLLLECFLVKDCMEIYGFQCRISAAVRYISAICMILIYVFLCSIFGYITIKNNERVEAAKNSSSEAVHIAKLPYSEYLHCSDVYEVIWNDRFKLFYGIPEERELIENE